jgi:hypothetical protein
LSLVNFGFYEGNTNRVNLDGTDARLDNVPTAGATRRRVFPLATLRYDIAYEEEAKRFEKGPRGTCEI